MVETYNALGADSIADAVAEAVGDNLSFTLGDAGDGAAAEGRFNVLDNAASHRVLRALLGARPAGRGDASAAGADDARPAAAVAFAGKLFSVMKGKLGDAALSGNRGAFTVAHLVSALPTDARAAAVVRAKPPVPCPCRTPFDVCCTCRRCGGFFARSPFSMVCLCGCVRYCRLSSKRSVGSWKQRQTHRRVSRCCWT